MINVIKKSNQNRIFPAIFLAFWSVLLLANFVPSVPQPSAIIGYLWKVEFFLAAFLMISIISVYKFREKFQFQFGKIEIIWIILPIFLFTVWSGFSVFWAESARNAIHHTLLWACYLIFYLLMRQIAAKPQTLNLSLTVCSVVVVILGAVCLSEYFTTSAEMSGNVSLRYSKYAEAIATIFVFFAALAIRKNNRNSMFCGAVALVGWLGIIFSLGRTQFVAAIAGISVFAFIAILKSRKAISPKKAFIFSSIFVLITIFSQISFSGNANQTTLKRLAGDEQSQMSLQVRFLIWNIAFENFKQNPLIGTGAENFVNNYQEARKNHAENNPNDKNLALYEEILPERAHNEFLQIASELGIIGLVFFVWLMFGILRAGFAARTFSLLTIASFAAIAAFLISSLASSYSFRVPANGLCFFFALAIFISKAQRVESAEKSTFFHFPFSSFRFPLLLICLAMFIFSAVRGTSLMYLQTALTESEDAQKESYFQKAIALDDQDAMLKYYYGLELYNNSNAEKSIPQIRFAIDRGISTSVAYFNLASAQIIAKQTDKAEETLTEALRVYPKSVFLRTAFASILEENGKPDAAQIQYEKALEINPEQARSWRTAFSEGMNNLSLNKADDKNFVKAMELRPTDAIYALLDFQRQFRPNLVRR